jgi:hypothetical protein
MHNSPAHSETAYRQACPLLPVDSYAFRFLQVLKNIHIERKNFDPVSSSEIIPHLPEYLQTTNLFEGIEMLYDYDLIQIHGGSRFSLSESYR